VSELIKKHIYLTPEQVAEAEALLAVRRAAGKERTFGELYRVLIADALDLAWQSGEFKGRNA
jgi:hypothetical protein